KEYAGAIADYEAAVNQVKGMKLLPADRPNNRPSYLHLHLASAYANCPDAKLRNLDKAIAVARQACETFSYQDPDSGQLLAALHARAGNFNAAVEAQARAVKHANPKGLLAGLRIQRGKDYEREAHRRPEKYQQKQ